MQQIADTRQRQVTQKAENIRDQQFMSRNPQQQSQNLQAQLAQQAQFGMPNPTPQQRMAGFVPQNMVAAVSNAQLQAQLQMQQPGVVGNLQMNQLPPNHPLQPYRNMTREQ